MSGLFLMRKTALIIALLSLLSAWSINEINLSALREDGVELRSNETVITADDASYIAPAQNLINSGELKNNLKDKSAYFLRPPGYSYWLILHGGVQTSLQLKILKISQLLLFSLSVYCLFFIAFTYLNSKRFAIITTSIYGVSTIASGFLYYTLTEAITPALMIFFVFGLIAAKQQENIKRKQLIYLLSSLLFAFIFITRPVLGVFALGLLTFILIDFWKTKKQLIITTSAALLIAFTPMIAWQIRNSKIAREYVGLHPVYFNQHSASVFRPTHKALWKLCKGWGETGANFHGYFGEFWNAGIKGDTSLTQRRKMLAHFPSHVVKLLGEKQIDEMLMSYQKSILYQKKFFDNQAPMPLEIPMTEKQTISKIETLVAKYKSNLWFEYYIKSPLKVFKTLAFHSNLSLYVYQKTFRGNLIMEIFRIFAFAIHSCAFTLLILSLFSKRSIEYKSIFSFTLLIYVGYLIFIQRGIEERYTLPVFAMVLLGSAQIVQQFLYKIKKGRT